MKQKILLTYFSLLSLAPDLRYVRHRDIYAPRWAGCLVKIGEEQV